MRCPEQYEHRAYPLRFPGATSADGQGNQTPSWTTWGMVKAFAFRLLITYFVFNFFRRTPANQPGVVNRLPPSTNMFMKGTLMEMYAFLSEGPTFDAFNDSRALFWHQPDLIYGDWTGGPHGDGSYTKTDVIACRQFPKLMHNGSLYLHVYIVKRGFSPDPNAGNRYSKKFTIYKSKMLTRYKRRRLSRTVNLLTGQTDSHPDLIPDPSVPTNVTYLPPTTHWHPNLTIHIVDDQTQWVNGSVPAPLDQCKSINNLMIPTKALVETNPYLLALTVVVSIVHSIFELLAFKNDIQFWKSRESLEGLSVRSVFFNVFQSLIVLLYVLDNNTNFVIIVSVFLGLGIEIWKIKKVLVFRKALVETNPYLLALTVVVSIVHSIFELLAFKNGE
ncbi:hypothetical protein AHF37_07330 [Paragonimus kellicotti]|nr:hypothetical protein AHF37_07330 [Paragonimus kellicotti]